MKLNFSILIVLLILVGNSIAQNITEPKPKRSKITSEEEFERLYGKKGGTRLNKVTGEKIEIKSVFTSSSNIYGIL